MNCASSTADQTPPLSARTLMSVESLIVIGVEWWFRGVQS